MHFIVDTMSPLSLVESDSFSTIIEGTQQLSNVFARRLIFGHHPKEVIGANSALDSREFL